MISTEKVFYFLVGVFILLLFATIYKMYIVKKDVREEYQDSVSSTLPLSTLPSTSSPSTTLPSTSSPSTTSPSTTSPSTTSPFTTTIPTTFTDRRILEMQTTIDNLNGKLLDIENNNQRFKTEEFNKVKNMFKDEKDELLLNLDNLGEFHDRYSSELQKLLQQKYDFNNSSFISNQEIQQSRVRALEEEISKIQLINEKVENSKVNEIRSIICKSNSTKLNIHPIKAGRNPTGEFLIFLNNNCLGYTINGSEIELKVNQCSSSGTSRLNMKFELKEIKDYKDYNKAIKQEERDEKQLVMQNEDIFYPFYLVSPVNYPEKCLYVTDENMINIKTIAKSPNNRFRTSKTLGLCKNM